MASRKFLIMYVAHVIVLWDSADVDKHVNIFLIKNKTLLLVYLFIFFTYPKYAW